MSPHFSRSDWLCNSTLTAVIGCVTPFNRSDWLCAGPAGGDGATQGDVPVPRPDWPAAGVRAHQPGGCQSTAQVSLKQNSVTDSCSQGSPARRQLAPGR